MTGTPHEKQAIVSPEDGHRVDVFRDADGVPRCNSKRAHGKGFCRAVPVKGRLRCRMHGGTAKIGPAAHGWKSGKRSKYRVALGLAPVAHDPNEWLDMRKGIEVQSAIVDALVARIEAKDSPDVRKRCLKLNREIRDALAANDPAGVAKAIREQAKILQDGIAADRSLRDLSFVAEALTRQVKSAHAVRLASNNALNREDAATFLSLLVGIAREEAGSDVAARILTRVHREALRGRLTSDGSQLREADPARDVDLDGPA